jgi:DNA-binding NarL/FixJ family response regulator
MDPGLERPEHPLRVLIVDCHPAFRIAAKALLETEGLVVLDDLETCDAAQQADAALRPDVVLIDVRPGRPEGLELARQLAAGPCPPAIVLMSTVTADELLADAVGANAFVSKAAVSAERLAHAAAIAGARREAPAPLELLGR